MDKSFSGMMLLVTGGVAWLAWTVSATVTRFTKNRSDIAIARRRMRTLRGEARGMVWRMIRVAVVLAVAAAAVIGVARAAIPH